MQPNLPPLANHPSTRPAAELSADDDLPGRAAGFIDSVIKPLIAIDFQGRILEVTPVAAMLFKGSAQRLVGNSIVELLPGLQGDVEKIGTPMLTTARRLDGSLVQVQLSAMRVCTDVLQGWLVLVQMRKAPSLATGLAQLDGSVPTAFDLP